MHRRDNEPYIKTRLDPLQLLQHTVINAESLYIIQHPFILDDLSHRAKKSQISRFMNYYLPTTLKLLNAYDRMDAAGVSGTNIDGTMGKIEAMMSTVVQAFDRQLDALFADEAMDISADITVMEQLLAQEGLTGPQLRTDGSSCN